MYIDREDLVGSAIVEPICQYHVRGFSGVVWVPKHILVPIVANRSCRLTRKLAFVQSASAATLVRNLKTCRVMTHGIFPLNV